MKVPPRSAIEDLRKIRQKLLAKEIFEISQFVSIRTNFFCSSQIWPIEERLKSIARRLVSNNLNFTARWEPLTQTFKVQVF